MNWYKLIYLSYIIISHDAKISSNKDYIVFKNWWSSGRYFIWTVGCFYGTGKELIEKAYKDSELSGNEYKRIVEYVNSINNYERKNWFNKDFKRLP